MKKLQNKILKKVYSFETKRTALDLIVRIGSILIVISVAAVVFLGIIRQLIEQQTFDLFQLFQEDAEIIKEYLGDALNTVYEELPKPETIVLTFLTITFLILVLTLIKNSGKIRNKIRSLKKYWLNRI